MPATQLQTSSRGARWFCDQPGRTGKTCWSLQLSIRCFSLQNDTTVLRHLKTAWGLINIPGPPNDQLATSPRSRGTPHLFGGFPPAGRNGRSVQKMARLIFLAVFPLLVAMAARFKKRDLRRTKLHSRFLFPFCPSACTPLLPTGPSDQFSHTRPGHCGSGEPGS